MSASSPMSTVLLQRLHMSEREHRLTSFCNISNKDNAGLSPMSILCPYPCYCCSLIPHIRTTQVS